MKKLDRYILTSIFRTGIVALLIFSLLVMAVETFMNIDKFISNDVGFATITYSSFMALGDYFIMITSVSMLFSVTYFLSNLSANNELIALYTAGFSKARITRPIFILSVILSVSFMFLNETSFLQWKNQNEIVKTELFGVSGTHDARNIALNDIGSGYLVQSRRYNEELQKLYDPLVMRTEDDRVILRLEAESAIYRDDEWIFDNVMLYEVDGDVMKAERLESYVLDEFDFPPSLFKSQNMKISTMEYRSAVEYLERLRQVNPSSWVEKETEFLRRLSEPLGIFVLMMISILMNYTFKKNILLFSIVQSLLIAVVYYVSDMVFSIVCKQGMIAPYYVVVMPLLFTVILSFAISAIGKRF